MLLIYKENVTRFSYTNLSGECIIVCGAHVCFAPHSRESTSSRGSSFKWKFSRWGKKKTQSLYTPRVKWNEKFFFFVRQRIIVGERTHILTYKSLTLLYYILLVYKTVSWLIYGTIPTRSVYDDNDNVYKWAYYIVILCV